MVVIVRQHFCHVGGQMIRNIAIILILALLAEIPALGSDKIITWSGKVELSQDITIPPGHTLIIEPGTKIYPAANVNTTVAEYQIIVQGDLIVSGRPDDPVVIDSVPCGLSTITLPLDPSITTINITPQKVDTERIRQEFGVFRLQYLALWAALFGGVYYAIRSRKD